jgi:hypothetical protein
MGSILEASDITVRAPGSIRYEEGDVKGMDVEWQAKRIDNKREKRHTKVIQEGNATKSKTDLLKQSCCFSFEIKTKRKRAVVIKSNPKVTREKASKKVDEKLHLVESCTPSIKVTRKNISTLRK